MQTDNIFNAESASASTRPDVDIAAVIDAHPVSRFQIAMMVLVALCVVMDGFDAQAMAFVAPAVIQAWHIPRAALGPVFSSSLVGMLFGSLTLGPLSDRIGRRPVLIGSTLTVSAAMLSTAFSQTLGQLLLLRLITGFGLGGIMGNAMALVSEYSPARIRTTLMMCVSCGFTAGAAFGGFVAAVLIPLSGWPGVFVFGGIVPCVIAIVMALWLPESLQYIIARGCNTEQVDHWLRRIAPLIAIHVGTRYVVAHNTEPQKNAVKGLFSEGRTATTLLLWCVNFLNLLNLFFLTNWLPTIASDVGYRVSQAALIGAMLQVGGVMGTLGMGPIIDRFGFFRVLIPTNLVAAFAIVAIGYVASVSLPVLLLVVFVAGFGIVGGQPANNTLSASIYPVRLRATGVSWSLGIGRAGSIVGPIIAGGMLQMHWSRPQVFCAAAIPAIIAALTLRAMSRLQYPDRRQAKWSDDRSGSG